MLQHQQQLSHRHQPVAGVYGQDGSVINLNSQAAGGSPPPMPSFTASPQQLSRNNSFPFPQGGHRPLSGNPLPPTSSSPPPMGSLLHVEEPHVHKGLLFVSYHRGGKGQWSGAEANTSCNDDDVDEYEFNNCGGSKKKKGKKRTKSEGEFSQDTRGIRADSRPAPPPLLMRFTPAIVECSVQPLSGVHEYTAFSGERVRNSFTANSSYDGRGFVSSVGVVGASHNQNALIVGPSGVLSTTHKGVVVVARYAQQQRGGAAAAAAPPPTPSSASNSHLQATAAGSYYGNAFTQQSTLPHMSTHHMNMAMGPPNSQISPPQTTSTYFTPPSLPLHPQGHLHPLPPVLPLPQPLQQKVSDAFAFHYDEAEASLLGDPTTALSCYCNTVNARVPDGQTTHANTGNPLPPPLREQQQQQLSIFAVLFANKESMTITNYIFSEHLKQRKAAARGEEHERRSIEMAFFVVARDIIAKEETQRVAREAEGVEERRAEENEALVARRVEEELARRGLMNVIGNVVTASSSSEKDAHPNSSEETLKSQQQQQQETPNSPNTNSTLTSSGGGEDDGKIIGDREDTPTTAGSGFSSSPSPRVTSASPSPPAPTHPAKQPHQPRDSDGCCDERTLKTKKKRSGFGFLCFGKQSSTKEAKE